MLPNLLFIIEKDPDSVKLDVNLEKMSKLGVNFCPIEKITPKVESCRKATSFVSNFVNLFHHFFL